MFDLAKCHVYAKKTVNKFVKNLLTKLYKGQPYKEQLACD